jgi:hypothetical protein
MTDGLRTPDFDHYDCDESIVAAEAETATTVKVTGRTAESTGIIPWTLRENATDPTTTAAVTRERLADIATWGDDIAPISVDVAEPGLSITWAPDGLVARYDLGWLPLRLFPDMAGAHADRGYRAIHRFTQLCDSAKFRVAFPFRAGDCVVFDNRRVMHGREAFEEGAGDRHLRGCYVDRDDLYSRLRMLARTARGSRLVSLTRTGPKGST